MSIFSLSSTSKRTLFTGTSKVDGGCGVRLIRCKANRLLGNGTIVVGMDRFAVRSEIF